MEPVVATGGTEGVDGSSPSEGSAKAYVGAEKAADGSDREPRIVAFTLRGRCSECVRGRLPLPEALRDELGALLLAPAVQHLEV